LLVARDWSLLLAVLIVCRGLLSAAPAQAQTTPSPVVLQQSQNIDHLFNWYYASVYGTGYYKIGEESVAVVRLPFAHTLRQATDDQWGLRLTLPVSGAFADFDLREFDLGRVSTAGMSFVPGLEVVIPLSPAWTVKPFASLGMGRDFHHDSNALIYSVGATTVYQQPISDSVLSALGGKLVYAGYQSGGERSILGALAIGGDLGFPLAMEISGRQAILGTTLIGTVYFNNLDFLMPGSPREEVSHEVEVALTLGARRPFEVLGIGFDRFGLGYRWGSDGLRGVRLVGSFPF
jgi:hypothetical protein